MFYDEIKGAVEGLLTGARGLIKEFHLSPEDKLKYDLLMANQQIEVMKMLDGIQQAQIELNKIEAQGNMFQKGWRPFLGWVGGAGVAFAAFHSVIVWVAVLVAPSTPPPPTPDLTLIAELLFGMLGLGTLRSWEKSKGVAR